MDTDTPKLLIIDDVEDIRTQMKWALADDYEVAEADDRASATKVLEDHRVPVVTLDLGLPPDSNGVEEGFLLLGEILQRDPNTKVIVITGQEQREHALRAISLGAYDYFNKPIHIDELKVVLRRAHHLYQLEKENREYQKSVTEDSFEGLVGFCKPMQDVFKSVRRVAGSDAQVLITGDSGTGKELVAHAIHRLSDRSPGPLRCHQLRRHSREPPRERALRTREGELHRRPHPAPGPHRVVPSRNPLSR